MKRKILIADDSTTIRKVVEHAFAGSEVKVIAAADGPAAVDAARRELPDLVLCDVLMPGMSGYEVAEALARDRELAGVPVLLLTGAFEPFDEGRATSCGAAGFLAKPFESQVLKDRVLDLLEGRPERPRPAAPAVPAPYAPPVEIEWPGLPPAAAPVPPVVVVAAPAPTPAPAPAPPPQAAPEPAAPPPADHDDEPLGRFEATPHVWPVHRVALPGDEDFDLSRPAAASPRAPVPRETSPTELESVVRDEIRRQVQQLAPDILREIAWEILPDLLERLIRESLPNPRTAASPRADGPGERRR